MYGFCFQLHSWCKCVKKMMLYTLNAFRWFFFSTATNFKDRLMLRENESEITKSRTGFQSRIVVFDINCILSDKSKFIYLNKVVRQKNLIIYLFILQLQAVWYSNRSIMPIIVLTDNILRLKWIKLKALVFNIGSYSNTAGNGFYNFTIVKEKSYSFSP